MINLDAKQTKQNTIEKPLRNKSFDLVIEGYDKDKAILEASRCLRCKEPTCIKGCPVSNNIPEFLKAVVDNDINKAYDILSLTTCFPDICGIVCPHEKQCVGNCIRNNKQEGVNIGAVEAYVGSCITPTFTNKKVNKKVACIGSGPASLAFAFTMLKNGYDVDIYEKENYIGGVLKWGIPSYRLDENTIDKYIKALKDNGVNFILNSNITSLTNLKEKYESIFIGTGATKANKMHIEGEELENVIMADVFLKEINLAKKENRRSKYEDFKNIVVVGGGNVAMDASRDAIRLENASNVTIVYRRTKNEMPAGLKELDNAIDEGINFKELVNPVRFIGNTKVNKVELAIMELSTPDESGRQRPVESNKEHIFMDVDAVILALGFNNEDIIKDDNLNKDKWGCFVVDEYNETSIPNVYAGGDSVTGALTVVKAMKAGINAAKHFVSKNIK